MSCFWCQQESSLEFCTQCCATAHTSCLVAYFVNHRRCPVCRGEVRPDRRLEASRCAWTAAKDEYGCAHENSIMRSLDVAIALSAVGDNSAKRILLAELLQLKVTAGNRWLLSAARVEHARACMALHEYSAVKRSLRPLWQLRGSKDRIIALLYSEGLCIYARASLHLGQFAAAWASLKQALRISALEPGVPGNAFAAASTLRTIADCQMVAGSMRSAAGTLRRVTCIFEQTSPRDPYAVACAQVDEGAAQMGAGMLAEAGCLLRGALPILRKRRGEHTRVAEAATMLASLVRPRKRIRVKMRPECVEEEVCPP